MYSHNNPVKEILFVFISVLQRKKLRHGEMKRMWLISCRVAIDKFVGKTFYFLGSEGELKHLGGQG